ncbi:MAG: alkaline phosphatase D [Flavobacteriales bacterium]|jgi:alkaline phosphatase D
MKNLMVLLAISLVSLSTSCQTDELYCGALNNGLKLENVTRIGFGSCADQDKSQPALIAASKADLDVFVWLGDNIYGDTYKMKVLREKYGKLGCKPEFRKLNEETFYLSVWDDHDYGKNDAGKEYSKKEESKQIFLDFWSEPSNSERRNHLGIYHSVATGEVGKRVQFIMLDTRTFRDSILPANGQGFRNDYRPHTDSTVDFLGDEQWAWLETVLREPAELRVVCSSNQFGISYNGFEAWANFPAERRRFAELIKSTQANGVVFISGDVHYSEVSKFQHEGCYPLYDVTSSGITQTWHNVEENTNRVGEAYESNNFGVIEIDWEQSEPTIFISIRDVNGNTVNSLTLPLPEISF